MQFAQTATAIASSSFRYDRTPVNSNPDRQLARILARAANRHRVRSKEAFAYSDSVAGHDIDWLLGADFVGKFLRLARAQNK